ncbi:AfsR/SARP family transcriptional regulator [Nocardioides caldifontis]|uniref:AfsR/SARP family transcriptional regulator n=1 Tax=Nocardioides caldifontis TaxID=2588938 RepID=UPI001396C0DF|nr:BTAD domain-containing putative transcriptional regulator [Nocardioides caldifontis]
MGAEWGIRVLGTVDAVLGDRVVDVGARRNREVLAALALDAGRVVPAPVLVDRIWADGGTGASTANLHAIVSRLRSRLVGAGIEDAVVTRPPGYLLQVDPDQVDALRFGRLVSTARQLRADGDVRTARAAVQEALDLWRGTAYSNVSCAFSDLEAARLEEQRLGAVELSVELDLALGRDAEVAEQLVPLVEQHPLREGLRGSLMTALYRTGRQADALQVYEQGRAVLAEELGLDPGPELQRLHQRVLTQDEALLPPSTPAPDRTELDATGPLTRPAPARSRALVVPPTRLYGREADVAAVTSLLRTDARLVTLVGPGGVGKTRLAAAVTDAVAEHFPDGTVQVSLAPVSDASDVVATVGRAVGLTGDDELDAVAAHIGEARQLLVLDNFEHVMDAATDVGRLVALCPQLTVLVTSRSPLRVRAEREHAVDPLGLPPLAARTSEELAAAPAGALLLDRARSVEPRAGSTPDDVEALAELCHRLSGLPLAIELVTARMRTLPPRALLRRLDAALSAEGARDLPQRQRTMRAALDWSHGLLDADQQRMFTLLGTFRGGAELSAVEAVATAGDDLPADDVLTLLDDLVAQSLVRVRHGAGGATRFDMLEPVAQYARSLLDEERSARLRRAHAATFRELACEAAVGYELADQVAWLDRTEADEANLVAAVESAVELGDADTAATITWSLWLYWWLRGGVAVGRRLAELCLTQPLSPPVHPRGTLAAATMSYAQGDHAAASAHWAEALRLGEELGDEEVLAKASAGTGLAAMAAGDLELAARQFRTALGHTEKAGAEGVWMASLTHVWLGTTLLVQGRPTEAASAVRKGLEIARARGDRLATYVALYNLSQAALAAGDDRSARQHVLQGLVLSEETGDRANLAHCLEMLALVEFRAQAHRRVATLLGGAQALREEVGSVYGYYLPDESLRAAAEKAALENLGPEEHAAAVERGRAMGDAELVRYARRELPDG